jgi:hypothetical protein
MGGSRDRSWSRAGPRAFERVAKPSSQKANAAFDLAADRA